MRFPQYSLKDMWLGLTAVLLVMMVVGNSDAPAHPAPGGAIDDAAIAQRVRAALGEVSDARDVIVRSDAGRVVLSGRVASAAARRRAEEAAWSAAGVRSVSNRLVASAH